MVMVVDDHRLLRLLSLLILWRAVLSLLWLRLNQGRLLIDICRLAVHNLIIINQLFKTKIYKHENINIKFK